MKGDKSHEECVILCRMVRKGLSDEMSFEQKPGKKSCFLEIAFEIEEKHIQKA